ncbi:uncharacterized protein THITE_2115510 [Thermothielavioides terrestris NRRL 8126]|uniref:Uncharacterized protein n=2 Tax=Thermothielavioides terrestris TaxID=2587410 RepID=G2R4U7_THETT|nr:uncharacterized protein THITE_2115510 [Thermothielavioides terrestris NRRL 8126]AEO66933.1 hypothetical protein THITE_2115510 [Thermothielavioides terrestris NRRL 8126]
MAVLAPVTPRQSMQEISSASQIRDFAPYNPYTPNGTVTPTPSAQTDGPLLPTNNPVPPTPSSIHKG